MSTDRVDPYEDAIRGLATSLLCRAKELREDTGIASLVALAQKLLDDLDRQRCPAAAARASEIAEAARELSGRVPGAAAKASEIRKSARLLFDRIMDHLERQPTGA